MHLHPFGESISIKDLTTGKILWKGRAKNHPKIAKITEIDNYSDPIGLTLYKNHHYELETLYNNTTNKPVDAMGALWVYYTESK